MAKNRISVLNPHLTKKGATTMDGNDRVARAYRDHQPSGPAKDIFDRVSNDSNRNYGLSAQVFSGQRKAHPAKDSSAGSGIDRDTPKFKKQRDWN
jgi:hypothetical protein